MFYVVIVDIVYFCVLFDRPAVRPRSDYMGLGIGIANIFVILTEVVYCCVGGKGNCHVYY